MKEEGFGLFGIFQNAMVKMILLLIFIDFLTFFDLILTLVSSLMLVWWTDCFLLVIFWLHKFVKILDLDSLMGGIIYNIL
jgi:hypothetical protein